MPTDTDLVNQALGLIGQDRINSLDNTVASKVIQTSNFFLPRVKRSVLRGRDWNCARKREVLIAVDNPAVGEWSYAYRLPTDCLAMRRFSSNIRCVAFAPYSVEGRILLTNNTPVKIVYTAEVTNPNLWDTLLFDACATRLAAELAGPIVRDFGMAKGFWEEYMAKIDEATGVDEAEGGIEKVWSDTLVQVRY